MLFALGDYGPLFRRISDGIKTAMRDNILAPGDRLPSSRDAARALGVSRNAVVAAYELLAAEGYITCVQGAGSFVTGTRDAKESARKNPATSRPVRKPARLTAYGKFASQISKANANDGPVSACIDFAYGHAQPDTRAARQWSVHLRQYAAPNLTGYGDPQGLASLREAVAHHLSQHRGLHIGRDDIIITNGTQQGLDLISRTMIASGDSIAVEDPHYDSARQVFLAQGAKLVTCPVDKNGLDTQHLRRSETPIRLVYVTPSHQFPTGHILSIQRRRDLLSWCAANDAFVIEDDYDSEFRYDTGLIESLKSLDSDGRVIYLGTFAKTLCPSLRLGFIVAPPGLKSALTGAKFLSDRGSSLVDQSALASFIETGDYARHLRRASRRYMANRDVLAKSIRRHFGNAVNISGGRAGVHFVLEAPKLTPTEMDAWINAAAARSVRVQSVAAYYRESSHVRPGLILGYATLGHADIETGVGRLAEAYRVTTAT